MKLSPVPFRDPMVTESGACSVPWQNWFRELHGVIQAMPTITAGADDPTGLVTGVIGDLRTRTNGGASTSLYVKESGPGLTSGWVAK